MSVVTTELDSAAEHARICALASRGQRDLQNVAAAYPAILPDPPVDPSMLGAVAMSTAFIAPWCTAAQLRTANRTSLWITAEDWEIDYRATSATEVADVVARCTAVAEGAAPDDGDQLGLFLARIRDDLATVDAFAARHPLWSEEVRRVLAADAREWHWKADGVRPTVEDYLANSDGFGATFVNVSHWLATGDPDTLAHLDELIRASRQAQEIIRLVNDLASHERDARSGDLNILSLGLDTDDVRKLTAERMTDCRALLAELSRRCPRQAVYLAREIGYTSGFYRQTDFWGHVEQR
ncbi:terpene synthase family protein [Micromonospora sp. NPDC000207]|uniref:terpene synthase family protein n=1 Tax=Micromonospora sp. NPDC000207 TaxID=3154246 RepID=UPI003326D9CA